MRDITKKCLERLEEMIDEEHIQRTVELQKRTFCFEETERIPVIIYYDVPEDEWPFYDFKEIFEDREKMLLSELKSVYTGAKLKDDRLYGIRANYGTGIIASIFGCPVHTFEKALPCATAAGDINKIKEIVDRGVPDIYGGICGKALETVSYFREVLSCYPMLNRHVGSMLLDIQGTFDNASIIWGSDIFLNIIDEPELVMNLMGIVTDTIRSVVTEHRRLDGENIYGDSGDIAFIGGICLRNDSCINLSGEMYETYVKPFDRRLLNEFTGNIHFCGKAHQWWERLMDIEGLKAINPYQSEFYDLKRMYPVCEKNRVAIYNWTVPIKEDEKELVKTGLNRLLFAEDFDAARILLEKAHNTGWV